MEILEMITEWRKGCSCSMFDEDGNVVDQRLHPESCQVCTVGLIDAIERAARQDHPTAAQ